MNAHLTVKFQPDVWDSLTPEAQQAWLDQVVDAVNELAHVSDVKVESKGDS